MVVLSKIDEKQHYTFKSRFSVEPSKFQMYFANDCRVDKVTLGRKSFQSAIAIVSVPAELVGNNKIC